MSSLLQKIKLRDVAPEFTAESIEKREPISIEVKEINEVGLSAVELFITQGDSTRSVHIEQHGDNLVLSIASQRDKDLDAVVEVGTSKTTASGIGVNSPAYTFSQDT